MMEDLMERMMDEALGMGADHVELRHQTDRSFGFLMKNGVPEVSSTDEGSGIGMRVLVDGALGFGAINTFDNAAALELVRRTVINARSSARMLDRPLTRSQERSHRVSYTIAQKKPFSSMDESDFHGLLSNVDASAVEAASKMGCPLPGRFIQLETLETEKLIITSEGSRVESTVPRVMMHMILTASHPERGSSQRSISKGGSGGLEVLDSWDLVRMATEEGSSLAEVSVKSEGFDPGVYDLILGPEVVGLVAHESSGHPGEADRILGREAAQAGETYLGRDSRGMKVGSDVVNVVDDPTLPGSFGYYLYDDEGIPARRRKLIRNGIIDEFLHDRYTAAEMGMNSNGSSRSVAFDREPIVRMANTYVDRGDHSLDELVEDVRKGILIENFMEWNIDDRRYNQRYVGLCARAIEDGEVKGLMRSPVLEITTPGLWSSIDAVGDDLRFDAAFCGKGDPMQGIPVWTGGPHVRLRCIRIGGR